MSPQRDCTGCDGTGLLLNSERCGCAVIVHEDYCGYPDDCNCCKVRTIHVNPLAELVIAHQVLGIPLPDFPAQTEAAPNA